MALIKCPNCGEEVSSKAQKCIHCGKELATESKIRNNSDVEKTVDFFTRYARTGKVCCFVLAAILAVVGIIPVEETDGMSLLLLIGSVILIGTGILFEQNAKWKAFMLRNTYEINVKMK